MSEPRTSRPGVAWWLVVGLGFLLTSESLRVAFPLLYDVREDAGAASAVAWALAAFAVIPALAPLLRRLVGPVPALRLAVVVLAAARIGMQLLHPIPLWLAATAVAAGLVVLILGFHGSRARACGAGTATTVAVALSVDAAIRGAYETWDPVWRSGIAPVTLAAVLAGTLVGCAFAPGLAASRDDREPRRSWTLTLFGPFVLLQTLFLQNAAFLASETGIGIEAAVVWVLAGDTLAVAAVVLLTRRPELLAAAPIRAVVATGLLLLVVGLSLTSVRGILPIAQVLATILLLWALDRPISPIDPTSAFRTAATTAVGMALFVGGAFAYQIDIDVPLPVPRATWPIVTAAVLCLAAVPTPHARPLPAPRRLWAVPAVLLAAVGIALGLAGVGSEPRPIVPTPDLRVMSWNIHTAVNGDGNVDLETIAEEVERRDPTVVLLQEVGRGWPIAGQVDQAEWLARRLDMGLTWVSAADDQFGNAVLTNLPILRTDVLRLPYGEGPQHRSALRIRVDTMTGWQPWIVDTHLQNGDKASTREDQIVALLQAWGDDAPTVIGGDLNMQPTEDNVALFVEAGFVSTQDAVGDPDATSARDPAFPGDRVDWIWVSQDLTPSNFTAVSTPASDHLPLVVTVSDRSWLPRSTPGP